MQQAAFAAAGIEAAFDAIEMTRATLAAGIERLRTSHAGWNVTTPLKEAIVPYVDALSVEARAIGAVNVVRREDDGRLTGHNTDGDGFVRGLIDIWNWNPTGRCALILGSGPAARAIAFALRAAGVLQVFCWSRNKEKAETIGPMPDRSVNLLVSALPADAAIPAHVIQLLANDIEVVDLNYNVMRSPVADVLTYRRSDGVPMLLHQGALSFEWWTGRSAPLEVMRKALGWLR